MKFKLACIDDLDKLKKSEIVSYVTKLHDFIKSQQKKLRKTKDKYKKLVNKKYFLNETLTITQLALCVLTEGLP